MAVTRRVETASCTSRRLTSPLLPSHLKFVNKHLVFIYCTHSYVECECAGPDLMTNVNGPCPPIAVVSTSFSWGVIPSRGLLFTLADS